MLKNYKRLISLTLVIFILFTTNITAFASENDFNSYVKENQEEITQALQDIINYSIYDYETGTWILDHAIVENGIFTEQQYQDAEEAGTLWKTVENEYVIASGETRALPAALILAIKAVGAIVGTTIVAEMTTYFLNWGLDAGCKKFQEYGPIESFCKANGFL